MHRFSTAPIKIDEVKYNRFKRVPGKFVTPNFKYRKINQTTFKHSFTFPKLVSKVFNIFKVLVIVSALIFSVLGQGLCTVGDAVFELGTSAP